MILLNKKRFGIIVCVMIIGIFTFMLQTNKGTNTIETVSVPVSQKVIIVDAGHGKPDEGAEGGNRN